MIGTYWFFGKAERATCGHLNVDHARGLLIMQYSWLAFHFLVFTSSFDNRMALKRRWCLESKINTVLVKQWTSNKETEESDDDSSEAGEQRYEGVDYDTAKNVELDSEGSTTSEDRSDDDDDDDDEVTDDEPEEKQNKKVIIYAKKDPEDASVRISFKPDSNPSEISRKILSAFPNIDGEQSLSDITTLDGRKTELNNLNENQTYLITTTLVID